MEPISSPVRRSGRVRSQPSSIYDEAKKAREREMTEQEQVNEDGTSKREEQDISAEDELMDNDTNDNDAEMEMEETDESDDDDNDDDDGSDDEDYQTATRKTTPNKSKSSTPKAKTPKAKQTKNKKTKKTKIQVQIKPKKRRKGAQTPPRKTKAPRETQIRTALTNLAKKVLPTSEIEDPSASLVSSLLFLNKAQPAKLDDASCSHFLTFPPTSRTARLHSIAKEVIAIHNDDPNRAQVKLLNLLFRSVGGTEVTDLNEEEDQLEEMGNEEWVEKVTDLVDEMRLTPNDCVLLCTDPDGAVHYNAVRSAMEKDEDVDMEGNSNVVTLSDIGVVSGSLGVREFRNIYEEFWYVLGHVALVEGGMGSASAVPFMDDEINDSSDSNGEEYCDSNDEGTRSENKKDSRKGKSKKGSTSKEMTGASDRRFDTEVVRDIISRIVELVSVGQPDVRAAATTAVLSLAFAILDKTVYLNDKLQIATRQFAAAIGGKSKNKTSAKAESLRFQIDSLKRTRAHLEETIESLVIKGVFMQRYRDANMFIRASSIQALGTMVVRRTDLFLKDKYLKYFGWMLSDKAECVRIAALQALNLAFQVLQDAEKNGKETGTELSLLEHVTVKFLGRIVDTVIDVHTSVQECGVKLMLSLLRAGFLDDVEDEKFWDQVNVLAFESASSPVVRRDALYFIMEQLEEFDDGEEDAVKRKKRKSSGTLGTSDRRIAQRLDAIASWAAHTLTDGEVPIDKIQIHLVDYLVNSLRDMPEHKSIVTNWPAMIRAISDEKVAMTSQGHAAGDRADIAKQRVLVQMLSCAAIAEVESVTDIDFLCADLDPDEANMLQKRRTMNDSVKVSKRNSNSKGLNHETLSVALIKALPSLLEKFRSDSKILVSLASLPRYFVPSVFSLPQRKGDFLNLFKNLTEIYLLSTDEQVLTNTARSIKFLSEGDHARSNEAKAGVKKLVSTISDRIVKHLSEKEDETNDTGRFKASRRKSPRRTLDSMIDSEDEGTHDGCSKQVDNETALYLNLRRARMLANFDIFSVYLDSCGESTEELCKLISKGLAQRLDSYKINLSSDTTDDPEKERWITSEDMLPRLTAGTVDEGLQLILATILQKLCAAIDEENLAVEDDNAIIDGIDDINEDDDDIDHHPVLTLRDCLISLVVQCYEQFLPSTDDPDSYTATQQLWADRVQQSGGEIAADLRSMFPKEWSDATSPLLRAFAIVDDSCLIGGYVRFIKSKEAERLNNQAPEDEGVEDIASLLLPLGRAVAVNWKLGNRLEAGMLLSHITGSGVAATEVVTALSRILKQVQPVRFLEAQMASLRQSYENWMNNDPDEIDAVEPTEEEMAHFEEEEAKHEKQFENIVQCASKFSSSLGVTKLSDEENLSPALVGFLKEGIRFSFSNSDEFQLGSRLSFLSILIKYAHWVKKNPEHKLTLASFLEDKEIELKAQQDDAEMIHQDDLRALVEFRFALNLEDSPVFFADASTFGESNSQYTSTTPQTAVTPRSHPDSSTQVDDDESRDTVNDLTIAGTSAAHKSSRGSSLGSVRSIISSVRNSLSPLLEEGNEEDSEETPSTPGRSKRSRFDESVVSSAMSKRSRTEDDIGSRQTEYDSNNESPTSNSKTQSTFDGEQSDLESPHK